MSMQSDRLVQSAPVNPPPTAEELAAFRAWQTEQSSQELTANVAAPAAAPAGQVDNNTPATSGGFKVGELVTSPQGTGVIIALGDANRVDATGAPVVLPGYRVAYFATVIDSPHTAEELGLEAL